MVFFELIPFTVRVRVRVRAVADALRRIDKSIQPRAKQYVPVHAALLYLLSAFRTARTHKIRDYTEPNTLLVPGGVRHA
ncbi:hypothetical protein LOY55_15560 [Pseudomonas sp. B21-040]|jgi:hypothetical protein|uniref:hypothetical protein n=1 Tax=unclassified Pseudomonas TaxID=196821 RepID=UPI000D7B01C1|nr:MULTISPECIES: hypothetical protein [unclassified Pseudomonas]PWK45883.1 hypothetical protein C7534_101484 [Pseudomonas sp. OV226]UVL43418.1 hypothetical protein LOY55_15560 [Pseudomonas sp. B21-040]